MAAAKKKTAAPPPDDFDAHQFQVMHEAANQLPRTARGGARDLLDKEEKPDAASYDDAALESSFKDAKLPYYAVPVPMKDRVNTSRRPGLMEVQERNRFVNGEAPAVDTIYKEPQTSKPRPAALDKAHLRRGSDVHFKEETPVTPASVQEEPEEDPRIRFIDALNGSGPQKGELPAMQAKEDPRFKTVNGFRFYS
jgi:hypothetical protein